MEKPKFKWVKEKNEDGFEINVSLADTGEHVGNITVEVRYGESLEYEFTPYEGKPYYDDLVDQEAMVFIQSLDVEDKFQGQGVAKYITNLALKEIRKQYPDFSIFINASPMGSYGLRFDDLINYYKKFGFKVLDKFPEYKNAPMYLDDQSKIKVVEHFMQESLCEKIDMSIGSYEKYLGKPIAEKQFGDYILYAYGDPKGTKPFQILAAFEGEKVGSIDPWTSKMVAAKLGKDWGDSIGIPNAWVSFDHQRKGLATAMYDWAEELTGAEAVPWSYIDGGEEPMSSMGKAFWKSRGYELNDEEEDLEEEVMSVDLGAKAITVYKNPSQEDIDEIIEHDAFRAFLKGKDFYAWSTYEALHQQVRDKLSLGSDAIPLVCSVYDGKIVNAQVSDNSKGTKWYHNPDVIDAINNHKWLQSFKDSDGISISFFDEDIVGTWDELEESSDDDGEHLKGQEYLDFIEKKMERVHAKEDEIIAGGERPIAFRGRNGSKIVFISKGFESEGDWRITVFINGQPTSHVDYRSFAGAVRDANREGADLWNEVDYETVTEARGDWEKEGYSFRDSEYEISSDHYVPSVEVLFNGKVVGHVAYSDSTKGVYVRDVEVDSEHRRKGLATEMYSYIEKKTGRKMIPSGMQSDDAKKFWSQSNRPFGESLEERNKREEYYNQLPEGDLKDFYNLSRADDWAEEYREAAIEEWDGLTDEEKWEEYDRLRGEGYSDLDPKVWKKIPDDQKLDILKGYYISEYVRYAEDQAGPSTETYFSNPRIAKNVTVVRFSPVPISGFDYGYGPENLGLTVHYAPAKNGNLLFAFDPKDLKTKKDWQDASAKYGKYGYSFKVPWAVKAYHKDDYEDQVVFDYETATDIKQVWPKVSAEMKESICEARGEGSIYGMILFEGCDMLDILHFSHFATDEIDKLDEILKFCGDYFAKGIEAHPLVFADKDTLGKEDQPILKLTEGDPYKELFDALGKIAKYKYPKFIPHISVTTNVEDFVGVPSKYVITKNGEDVREYKFGQELNKVDEARTKTIKVDGKEVEAVLMAGGHGAKIYSIPGDSILVVSGKVKKVIPEGDSNFKAVMAFVNLKYQPLSKQDEIKDNFEKYVQSLSEVVKEDDAYSQTYAYQLRDELKVLIYSFTKDFDLYHGEDERNKKIEDFGSRLKNTVSHFIETDRFELAEVEAMIGDIFQWALENEDYIRSRKKAKQERFAMALMGAKKLLKKMAQFTESKLVEEPVPVDPGQDVPDIMQDIPQDEGPVEYKDLGELTLKTGSIFEYEENGQKKYGTIISDGMHFYESNSFGVPEDKKVMHINILGNVKAKKLKNYKRFKKGSAKGESWVITGYTDIDKFQLPLLDVRYDLFLKYAPDYAHRRFEKLEARNYHKEASELVGAFADFVSEGNDPNKFKWV